MNIKFRFILPIIIKHFFSCYQFTMWLFFNVGKGRSRTIILILTSAIIVLGVLFTFCYYSIRRKARNNKTILRENCKYSKKNEILILTFQLENLKKFRWLFGVWVFIFCFIFYFLQIIFIFKILRFIKYVLRKKFFKVLLRFHLFRKS